jgi:EmrB/QacA subfamily drug resistance transporter
MRKKPSEQTAALATVMVVSFLAPFMGSAVTLSIPSIGKDLGAGALMLAWVLTSYMMASAALLLPWGRLADITGRKRIFVTGIALFAVTSLLCGLARSIEMLIAFRVVQGAAAAMFFSTGTAILTSVYAPDKRGRALGLMVASVYLSLSLGPVVGGLMNHHLGWRSIFYVTSVAAAASAALAHVSLDPRPEDASGEAYDFGGTALYMPAIVAVLYGLSTLGTNPASKIVLLCGAGLLALFVRRERTFVHPLLAVNLLRKNAVFALSNLAAVINYSATAGLAFLISLHMQVVLGFDSQIAGLVMVAQAIPMALLSPVAGSLSDRFEPRVVASVGMTITSLGLLAMAWALGMRHALPVAVVLVVTGVGFALFSSPNTNAVMSSVEKRDYGMASSVLSTMRLTGQALSMAVVALLLSIYVGNAKVNAVDPARLVSASRAAFIVFGALCACGVLASLARGNVRTKTDRSG